MQLDVAFKRYADLLVNVALNIQPKQILQIDTKTDHRELALKIAERAYQAGAKRVQIYHEDYDLLKIRLANSANDEQLSSLPPGFQANLDEIAETKGARLFLSDYESFDISEDRIPAYKKYLNAQTLAKTNYCKARDNNHLHWGISPAATEEWAKAVFPDRTPTEAKEALWNHIFSFLRIDQEDYIGFWKKHSATLSEKVGKLDSLGIKSFKIKSSETDLIVGLDPKACFAIGPMTNSSGFDVINNIPTEECFTSPDWRTVQGHVQITRPVFVDQRLVKNLHLKFGQGILTDFSATEGGESFESFVTADPDLKKLGEVAMVGKNPIADSNQIFYNDLIDENASPHLALGCGFKECVHGGLKMSDIELDQIGFNHRTNGHQDFMFGSPDLIVTAICHDGREVLIIKDSDWQI